MDHVVKVNGIDIVIEQHSIESRKQPDHPQRNRLFSYYENLLKVSGKDTSRRKEALNHLIDNMTEKSAENKANIFDQAQLSRFLAYAEKYSELSLKPEEKIFEKEKANKMAEALVEVLDAVSEEDTDNQETVEINGNKFVYKKDLDIKNYVQKLFDIGEKTKGNTWTVYLDEEGELVIY